MLLGISFDGADSPRGGCTTHLASLFLTHLCRDGYNIYDYPWLVRLNPAVPHKTRGNGALAVWVLIDTESEALKLFNLAVRMAREYADATGSRKAAIAMLLLEEESIDARPRMLEALYWLSARRYVTRDTALRYAAIAAKSARRLEWEGDGLVGPLAALGANLAYDYTFELLFYMPPRLWGKRPRLKPELVKRLSYILGSYDIATYDYLEDKPLIQPHGPDPVLAGIRSDEPQILLKTTRYIPGEYYTHATLYRTNQHTDIHLSPCRAIDTYPYSCCTVEGVLTRASRLPGGHLIAKLCDTSACIDVAFYRETGSLRKAAEKYIGRHITVAGCIRPHGGTWTLNAEKIIDYENGEVYEPPPSTWHHLYMPYERYQRITRPRGLRPPKQPCKSALIATNV